MDLVKKMSVEDQERYISAMHAMQSNVEIMEIKEYIQHNLCHSIHTSARRSFRSCRRRHNWAYNDMLYPVVTPKPLEFGVAFHKAMEHFYEPQIWGISHEAQRGLALKAFTDECDIQLKNFRRLNGEPTEEVMEDYKERKILGLNMIKHYVDNVSTIYDQDFTPVRVEVPFEVPITGPQGQTIWCKCDQCWRKWRNSKEGAEHHDSWQSSLSMEDREVALDENL